MRLVRTFLTIAMTCVACGQPEPELDQLDSWIADFHAEEMWFNNKLRPDLQPLTDGQSPPGEDPRTPFVPELLSDADADPEEIATTLSLVRTGEFADERLRNTACLWVAPADEITLRWETAAKLDHRDEDIELIPGEDEAAFCTSTDPYTRLRLRSEDDGYWPIFEGPPEVPPSVKVHQRAMVDLGAFVNEHDECLPGSDPTYGQPTFAVASTYCQLDAGFYNACNPEGCVFDFTADSAFTLSNQDPDTGDVRNTLEVGPVLKRVSGTRQLVRRLSEDPRARLTFQWSVGELPDGRWTENFSSNIRITSLRVFGLLPSGQRVYLHPSSATVGTLPCGNVTKASDHSLLCGGADPAQRAINPAYEHTSTLSRLNWQFTFQDDPRQGGETDSCCAGTAAQCCDGGFCRPVCDGDEVHAYSSLQEDLFVEFTLVDFEHAAPDLFASPSRLYFGPVEWGSSWEQQVAVKNTGSVALQIVDIEITGEEHLFSYRRASGGGLPVNLAAGASLLLIVSADSAAFQDRPEGTMIVTGRASSGAQVQTRTALKVDPYSGPWLDILVPNAGASGGEMHLCTDADELSILVTNVGDRDLDRSGYTLEGPAASRFSLQSIDGTPLGPAAVRPATGDVVRVHFNPDPTGGVEQRAALVASSDARNLPGGEIRIPIVGFRDVSANRPGCVPWADPLRRSDRSDRNRRHMFRNRPR